MDMQARIRCMTRRDAKRYLRELAAIAEAEVSIRFLNPTRPPYERLAQHRAQDGAAAWIQAVMPVLIASLPPE
jgi:hypothetical protein